MSDDEAARRYRVLVNAEEQHAIWPAEHGIPAGWRHEGFTGTEAECSEHIDQVWTDITPLSLRRRR
jgi:MbtH protein